MLNLLEPLEVRGQCSADLEHPNNVSPYIAHTSVPIDLLE